MQRMNKMIDRVAAGSDSEEVLALVDQAIDGLIANLTIIDENLSKIKPSNVPEQAAIDGMREVLDEALIPYTVDLVKSADIFGGE